jgi:hypothetical protein
MGNHPFNAIVILFWLATMSWLVVVKILPPLRVGEPPSYGSVLQQSVEQQPVCWSIRLQDKSIGWAASKTVRRKDGITELYSRVYLADLPLDELAPGWLGSVLKPALRNFGPLDVDKKSRLVIDPLGRLVGFDSRVRVGEIPDVIKVQGQIEGSALTLVVQSGEMSYKVERYLPPDALMADELSPQARMPGLRVGQTWTVPLYSPFRPLNSPIEVLQASVEREDHMTWDGQAVISRIVVYRSDPGSGLVGNETRGKIWVRDDGLVLRQEVDIFRSRLHFVRLTDSAADEIGSALGDDWMGNLPESLPKQLHEKVQAFSP